jgi:lysozyme family protein
MAQTKARLWSAIVQLVATCIVLALVLFWLAGCKRHHATAVVKPTWHPEPTPRVESGIQSQRWAAAKVRPEKVHFVTALVQTIQRNQPRYATVAKATGVPWDAVAAIHNMECGLSFRQHLFNGDPLTGRTTHVPAGLPHGSPPFTWEESAIAALRYDSLDKANWSRLEAWLWSIEKYNGVGYDKYHPDVPTPYLWSWTTVYSRGKYVADGVWSPTAISAQCGVVPIIKTIRGE